MHVCTCSLSRNTPPWPHQTAKCIFFQSSREPSKIYEKRNMFRLACLCFDSLCSFFCSFHVFFFCGFFLVFLFAFVLISCSVFPFSALNFGCVFLLLSSIYLRFLPIFCLFFAHFFFCVSLCFSARFSPLSSPPFSRYPRLYFGPKYIPVPHVDNWTTPHISFSYVTSWVYFSARIFTCVFLLLYQCKIPHDQ